MQGASGNHPVSNLCASEMSGSVERSRVPTIPDPTQPMSSVRRYHLEPVHARAENGARRPQSGAQTSHPLCFPQSRLSLDFLYQKYRIVRGMTSQSGPILRILTRNRYRARCCTAHDRGDLRAELVHVQCVRSGLRPGAYSLCPQHMIDSCPICFKMAAAPRLYASNCTSGQGSCFGSPGLLIPVFSASIPMKLVLPLVSPCHSPAPA